MFSDSLFSPSFIDDIFDTMLKSPSLDFGESFPPSNFYVTEDSAHIELALSGYHKDEISIEVTEGGILDIKVEPKETEVPPVKYYTHRIKRLGFERKYSVPLSQYDLDGLSVSFVDGLLSICIPKAEKKKSTRLIEIQ